MKKFELGKGGEKIFKINKNSSVQEWLPIDEILENGVVKLKNGNYIKIIKIMPINYNLKSELEKQAILNSYKIFLKTCNFDLQILIQSKKEDLSKHISCVNNSAKKESKTIKNISKDYINYLNELNSNKKSATKNFYIIIKKQKKYVEKNSIENIKNMENIIFDELNDEFLIIKDTLTRCGNLVINVTEKDTCKDILFSFFYPNKIVN